MQLQRETDSQMAGILDEEQMKRYKELAQERRERVKEQRKKGGHRPPRQG